MNIKTFILSHKILYELYFFLSRKKINRRSLDKKIKKLDIWNDFKVPQKDLIVSLTSYGERLSDLKYTLLSLIRQSIKPEKIIVWLGDGEVIPDELHIFEKFGVEFLFCSDIKSYTKLIPALLKYPHKHIVTADDDIYYKTNWLKKIWDVHINYPHTKVTHIAHEVKFSTSKKILSYNQWNMNICKSTYHKKIFPTGVGGVLYPTPRKIESFFLDESVFMKYCPNADDIWFYFMGLLSGEETIIVPSPHNKLKYVDIYKEYGLNNKTTLQSANVQGNMNDVQFRRVMEYLNLTDEDLYNLIIG